MPRTYSGRRVVATNTRFDRRVTNPAAVTAALARGAAIAYRHRRALWNIGQTGRTTVRKLYNKFAKKKTQAKNKLVDRDIIQEDLGTGGELTKNQLTVRLGKKMSTLKMTEKLVKANKQACYYRISGISSFMNTTSFGANIPNITLGNSGGMAGGGYFPLFNAVSPTPITNQQNYVIPPLHVYDISSINNYVNNNSTTYQPAWQVNFGCAGNNSNYPATGIQFSNFTFQTANGLGSTSVWQNEDTPGANTLNFPLRRDLLEYVNAKFLCYGSAKMATEYKIEVIQLKDDYLHPEFLSSNIYNPPPTGDKSGLTAVSFWTAYASHSTKHPIASINPVYKKHIKVLKTLNFTLQPRLSTETDANVGHCKQINMFIRMNRLMKYDWQQTALDQGLERAGAYSLSQAANIQNTVTPRARIYLTVQALNPTSFVWGAGSASTDYTPSYDMVLRTKHTLIE